MKRQREIRASYDRQAGSYLALMRQPEMIRNRFLSGGLIAEILAGLEVESVCEAGTGEGSTLEFVNAALPALSYSAFDLSLPRLVYAWKFLSLKIPLFQADMRRCPLPDKAVDCVFTFHAIEPNTYGEEDILHELKRVAREFLVLVEPDYHLASEAQRARMEDLGYVRDLPYYATQLDMGIVRHEPWPFNVNPLNKASLLVLET